LSVDLAFEIVRRLQLRVDGWRVKAGAGPRAGQRERSQLRRRTEKLAVDGQDDLEAKAVQVGAPQHVFVHLLARKVVPRRVALAVLGLRGGLREHPVEGEITHAERGLVVGQGFAARGVG
jgi:hypothetical protein